MANFWCYQDTYFLATAKVGTTSLNHLADVEILAGKISAYEAKPMIWIIRDPVERVVSAWTWNWMVSAEESQAKNNSVITNWIPHIPHIDDFRYFTRFLQRFGNRLAVCEDLHWASQHRYLDDIEVSVNQISSIIDIKNINLIIPTLKKENSSPWCFPNIDKADAYNQIRPLVEKYYKEDFYLYERIKNEQT